VCIIIYLKKIHIIQYIHHYPLSAIEFFRKELSEINSVQVSTTFFTLEGGVVFGIKIILIEPALVISDFHSNVKMVGKGAANPYSPYTQMMQKLFEKYKQVEEQYQIPAEDVAKVILNAAILDNPDRRCIVGKYSEMMTEAKMTLSDILLHHMLCSSSLKN
jgi:hypothetical protein